ncbi:MAG TPA: hypothetical protein VGG71_13515 [Chitinophagaceae bacterium]|jgi:hypothetical protein
MNFKIIQVLLLTALFSFGCYEKDKEANKNDNAISNPIPVGENSFVYDNKVYKIINNELLQIGNLNDTSIRKLRISSSELKDLGKSSLSYIKPNGEAMISSVYRGNFLYFKFLLTGIDDLKTNYKPGTFSVQFMDEFGFTIFSKEISTNEMIANVSDGEIAYFEYDGKIELSLDAQASITTFNVSSNVTKK